MFKCFATNKLKKLRNKATVTAVAFILILTIASMPFTTVSFAQVQPEQPDQSVPGWKREGASPWYATTQGITGSYNASGGSYNPYSTAPNTPHILWTRQMAMGGLISPASDLGHGVPGPWFSFTGSSRIQGLISAGGRLFVGLMSAHDYPLFRTNVAQWTALDVHTGKEIWVSNFRGDEALSMAAALHVQYALPTIVTSCNQAPVVNIYDADTGITLRSYRIPEMKASNLLYNDTIFFWGGEFPSLNVACYSLGEDRIPVNLTLQWGPVDADPPQGILDDVVVCYIPVGTTSNIKGFNVDTGELLWQTPFAGMGFGSLGYGKYFIGGADGSMNAFDLQTGTQVWKSDVEGSYWGYGIAVADGKIYQGNYNGIFYCWDAETGEVEWTYDATPFLQSLGYTLPPEYEVWNAWPLHDRPVAADGKVYAIAGDHIFTNPMPAGDKLWCFNGETGNVLWTFPAIGGVGGNLAIADDLLFVLDCYTGKLFCFGKGPTAVDVSVPQSRINNGDYTWINGRVTDQSPAQEGTGCVSKDSMSAWMEYLHAGMPEPAIGTVKGVPVTLSAIKSDGSVINIGTVTADPEGYFSYKWTPPAEDQYTITATFAGDESYWDSYGDAKLTVGPAPPAETEPEPEEAPVLATTDLAIIAAVAVAIVIGLVNLWALRKRT